MSDWPEVTLGEVADLLVGYAYKSAAFTADLSGSRLLRGVNIGQGLIEWHRAVYWPTGDADQLKYHLAEGDVVLAMDRPWIEAGLKRARIRRGDLPALLVQRVARLRGTGEVRTSFIHHLLATERFSRYLQAIVTGATVPHISQSQIESFTFRLPPPHEQDKICGFLDALDELIENNRRRVEVLAEMARTIYREWFVHFRYPGHQHAIVLDSSIGPIPKDWVLSTCGDELISLGGGTPSKNEPAYWEGGTVRWYTPSDLTKSRCRYSAEPELRITEAGLAGSSARLFPPGSVLMTSRATLGVLTIATTAATTNQGFIVIPPDKRWLTGYILEWLDEHAGELASIATGATFKEITKGAFKRVPFLVPAQDVLDAHRAATDPIEQEVRNLEQQVRNLASLRDLLLPKLVTGQIDVSSLDLNALVEDSAA
jgi:type I restriction enzyme S subunit